MLNLDSIGLAWIRQMQLRVTLDMGWDHLNSLKNDYNGGFAFEIIYCYQKTC